MESEILQTDKDRVEATNDLKNTESSNNLINKHEENIEKSVVNNDKTDTQVISRNQNEQLLPNSSICEKSFKKSKIQSNVMKISSKFDEEIPKFNDIEHKCLIGKIIEKSDENSDTRKDMEFVKKYVTTPKSKKLEKIKLKNDDSVMNSSRTRSSGRNTNKMKTRWSVSSDDDKKLDESSCKKNEISINSKKKSKQQQTEMHNTVTVTFSKFEQFWEEQLLKKQFNEQICNENKIEDTDRILNKKTNISNTNKPSSSEILSDEIEKCSSSFLSKKSVLPNYIPLSECTKDEIKNSSTDDTILLKDLTDNLSVVNIPLPDQNPQNIESNINDLDVLSNVSPKKEYNFNEVSPSSDNKYSPEDIYCSLSSTEANKESPSTKPLLGRVQAKKRLQAFSMLKQPIKINKKILSPISKSPKIQVSIIAEEQYNENGEKVGDKIILKKPPKKGPCPQEKAKAVISEIEEMKRREASMLLLNTKPGLYSLIASTHNKPSPSKMMPTVPTGPKPITFNEKTSVEIKTLIEKVVSDEMGNLETNIRSDTSTHSRDSNNDDNKVNKSSKNHNQDRNKLNDKRKSHEKKKSSSQCKSSTEKNEKVKKPMSWSNIKEWGYDFATIRETKQRIRRNDEYKDKFGLEIQLKSFDNDILLRYPFPVKSVKNEDMWFPRENIKYTIKAPVLSYSENPVKYRKYPNRKQVLLITPEERKNIFNEFLKKCEKPEKYTKMILKSQPWYPNNFYIELPKKENEIEPVETSTIKSYGLSVLTENYRCTNWGDSDDEMNHNLDKTPKIKNSGSEDNKINLIHSSASRDLSNNKTSIDIKDSKFKIKEKIKSTDKLLKKSELNETHTAIKPSLVKDNNEEKIHIKKIPDNLLYEKLEITLRNNKIVSPRNLRNQMLHISEIKECVLPDENERNEYVKSPDTDEYLPNWEMEKDIIISSETLKSLKTDPLHWETDEEESKGSPFRNDKKEVENQFSLYSGIDENYKTENEQFINSDKKHYSVKNTSSQSNNKQIKCEIKSPDKKIDGKKHIESKEHNSVCFNENISNQSKSSQPKIDFSDHEKNNELKFTIDKKDIHTPKRKIDDEIKKEQQEVNMEKQKINEDVDYNILNDVNNKSSVKNKYIDEKKHRSSVIGELYLNDKKQNHNVSVLNQNQICEFSSVNKRNLADDNKSDYEDISFNNQINPKNDQIEIENNKQILSPKKSDQSSSNLLFLRHQNINLRNDWEEEELQEYHSREDRVFKKQDESKSNYEVGKESLNNWTEQNICDFRMREKDNSFEKNQTITDIYTEDVNVENKQILLQNSPLLDENTDIIKSDDANLLVNNQISEIPQSNTDFFNTNTVDPSFININSKLASEYEEFMKTVGFMETSVSDAILKDENDTVEVDKCEQEKQVEFNKCIDINDKLTDKNKTKHDKIMSVEDASSSSETSSSTENKKIKQRKKNKNSSNCNSRTINYRHKKYKTVSSSSSSNSSESSSSSETDSSTDSDSSSSSSSDSTSSSSSSSDRKYKKKSKFKLIKIKTEKESDDELVGIESRKANEKEDNELDCTVNSSANKLINLNSEIDKGMIKVEQKKNNIHVDYNESIMLKEINISVESKVNTTSITDFNQSQRTMMKHSETNEINNDTSESKVNTNNENGAINIKITEQPSSSTVIVKESDEFSEKLFPLQTPLNMFPDKTFKSANKSDLFTNEINFSNIKLATMGLNLYADNLEENIESSKTECSVLNLPKKTFVSTSVTPPVDSQSPVKLKSRQLIPIKLLTNESRIQSIKLNLKTNKNDKDSSEFTNVVSDIKSPGKQFLEEKNVDKEIIDSNRNDAMFPKFLETMNSESSTINIANSLDVIQNKHDKEMTAMVDTSLKLKDNELYTSLKIESVEELLSNQKKQISKQLNRDSSSDNEYRKNSHRSDEKKYSQSEYDRHVEKEHRRSVEINRRSKDYNRDKNYYEPDRYRRRRSRDRSRESRRRDYKIDHEKHKYKYEDRLRSSGDLRRSRSPLDDRSRRTNKIPLSDHLELKNKSYKNLNFDLEQSPNSPVGIKCSVADSTISDSELPTQTSNDDRYYNVAQDYPCSSGKVFKAACLTSPRMASPRSPKRISLDDRINQVLGIEKETPKPIDTVYSQGSYSNYPLEYYEQYQNYTQNSNYDLYDTSLKGSVNNTSNYYTSYDQNIDPVHSQHATRVLQVGNVLQVVPTESIHREENKSFDKPSASNTTQVVQVGNMLQIVPSVTTPLKVSQALTAPVNQAVVTVISEKNDVSSIPPIGVEKEILLKKAEKQKRRTERENRRQERQQKRLEKEKRRELKIKLKNENMIKRALLLESEEGISEISLLESNKQNFNIDSDTKEDDEQPIMWPPSVLAPVPLPQPPAKGILVTPGFSKFGTISSESPAISVTETYKGNALRKSVRFADGICPGEGTSPSGGEELPSPPPPPRKLPKEQRYKKTKLSSKKKVKVKIIRSLPIPPAPPPEDSDDDDDDMPPPPPPPGSPPPHIWPPHAHINNTHPTINNISPYTVPHISSENPSFMQFPPHTSIHTNLNMIYATPVDSSANSLFSVGTTFSSHPNYQPPSSNFSSGPPISAGLPSNFSGQQSTRIAFNIPVIGTNNLIRPSTPTQHFSGNQHPSTFSQTPTVGTSIHSFSSPPLHPSRFRMSSAMTNKPNRKL